MEYNLQVLQFSYHPYSDDDADCELIIELTTIDGDAMTSDASIKVNLYDENGDIFYANELYVDSDEFAGYDTYKISLYDNSRTLLEAKSARVYMLSR